MSAKLLFLTLIAAAVAFEAAGDVLFKYWSRSGRAATLLIGLFIYFVGSVFWAFSLRHELLARSITVFTVVNLVVIVIIGMLYFQETLTLRQKLGIALGLISVVLVEL